ncbi:MAG: EthD domain-containing protein [Burkholderiales bacterium]
MFKIIVGLKRHPSLTPTQFREAWQAHGERVKQHPLTSKYLKKYVQNYALPEEYAKGEPPFDGVVEEWFESAEAYREFSSNPEYTGFLRAKISEFTDNTKRSRIHVDEEVVL